MSKSQMSQN